MSVPLDLGLLMGDPVARLCRVTPRFCFLQSLNPFSCFGRQCCQKDIPRFRMFRMGVSTVRIEKRIPLRSFLNVAFKAPTEVSSAEVSQLVDSSDDSIAWN
jgi:hypothetical protein